MIYKICHFIILLPRCTWFNISLENIYISLWICAYFFATQLLMLKYNNSHTRIYTKMYRPIVCVVNLNKSLALYCIKTISNDTIHISDSRLCGLCVYTCKQLGRYKRHWYQKVVLKGILGHNLTLYPYVLSSPPRPSLSIFFLRAPSSCSKFFGKTAVSSFSYWTSNTQGN